MPGAVWKCGEERHRRWWQGGRRVDVLLHGDIPSVIVSRLLILVALCGKKITHPTPA